MTTPGTPTTPNSVAAYRARRGRSWWLPLAIGLGAILALILWFSMSRDCGPVDRTVYQTEAAQEAAVARGDTIPADDPRVGTAVSVHACASRF